jgi:hypothetical protein
MIKESRPDALPSLEKIENRRSKAGKLVAGIAAVGNSDMFKEPVSRLSFGLSLVADTVLSSRENL